ncbi:MAG: stage II sporulation protein M [Terracidiphilus sp.]|nr:stage II sporulation protein M [Terracidiphilus sp.]MDR3797312.1 stage II sporulation protein M [Terracidiphilus sp.]
MAIILSNQWLQKRRPYWDRLSWLLNQAAQGGVRRLSRAELRETALLYRQAASDLSTLRQDPTARAYAELVNQLLARAHHIIYSSRRKGFRRIFDFLRDGYPALVQRQFRYVLLSLVIMVAGGTLGTVLTLARPEFMRHMLGPQMVDTIEHHEMWTESIVGVEPEASSAIMTNNLSVCFMAFAGGIVFGLFSIWSMFFNGLLLGVIGVACQQHGLSLSLWSFVAPHGSLELPSIVLAGAAGLRLGRGVAFPGLYRWRDSIALAGVESTRMVAGIIPLLVIAGTLEGFFSPSAAPIWLKFTVGGTLFTLLLVWLFRPVAAAVEKVRQERVLTPSLVPSPLNTD